MGLLFSSLSNRWFPIGVFATILGTVSQEVLLSTETNGVTTDILPMGLAAAVATGLAIGLVCADREKATILGFASSYLGIALGSGLFAAIHWGSRPEAGAYGWVLFLFGGILIGAATGWVGALAGAGFGFLGASLRDRLSQSVSS